MSQQPFGDIPGDIPLFRELQKLLSSSEGPINTEVARQVGGAVAAQAGAEPRPTREIGQSFGDAVHDAELLLSGYTRLSLDEPMRTEVVNRPWWVDSTLGAWKWLLDRLAERFTGELGKMGELGGMPGMEGETPAGGTHPMAAAMGQVGPLLLGLQAGQLLGGLSTETLTRYYYPIPRDDSGQLFFVLGNIDVVARDYGFDELAFRKWLATQEASRHLIMSSVPWLARYARSLLTDLVDSIELDVGDLERRMVDLQTKGVEALAENSPSDALPVIQSERHSRALDRVRAFTALFEGYGAHAAEAIMAEVVDDAARIDEGMARHRASPSEGQAALSSILGISFDRALETKGETFCAAVVKIKGLGALNKVWDAPDNLPSSEEIRDPFQWMERALDDGIP
ncbi:MAG: zinc-dependent metalloprotease [Actinomycetota bacterium]